VVVRRREATFGVGQARLEAVDAEPARDVHHLWGTA
jgi:hypothetical protein